MNSGHIRLHLTLVVIIIILSCASSTTTLSQDNIFKHYPWPPLYTPAPKEFFHSTANENKDLKLFTSQVHADTSLFTPIDAGLPGVIASDAVWIDYDNDGDLDILVSGAMDTSRYILRLYNNDNGTFTQSGALVDSVATEHGIAWGDYDNDGDFDLAIGGRLDFWGQQPVTRIYRNDGGSFTDIHAPLMQLNGCTATWIDYDLDGSLDLLITGSPDGGGTFFTKLYHNDNGTFSEVNAGFPGVWAASIPWGDYDADGYPDLLLTGYGDLGVTTRLYHNDGGTGFTAVNAGLQNVNSGESVWADLDNDGDLDIVLTGVASGNIPTSIIYRNDGNGQFVDINAGLQNVSVSALAVGDFDNDGDLDLALSGTNDFFAGTPLPTKIYRNDNMTFTDIQADIPGTWFGSLAWGDYDNDGKLDLLVTGGTIGRPYFYYPGPYYPITTIYHNNSGEVNTPPSPPVAVSVTPMGNQMQLTWNRAADDMTPQNILTYNVRLGTIPGGSDIIGANSNVSTGYHRIPKSGNTGRIISRMVKNLPSGTYYWSVQTIDNGFAASAFTSEQSFVVSGGPPTWWHMVSLPNQYPDTRTSVVFPTSTTNAFTYNSPSGYVVQDILENGFGYWLKFPTPNLPVPLSGGSLTSITISVSQGWNLIGSVSQSIPISHVTSQPPGMITSQFFGYQGSYATSDNIESGKAYWVKVSQSGSLTLSVSTASAAAAERIQIVPTGEIPPPPPDVTDGKTSLPKTFVLEQNYPNPFNPTTRIKYSLSEAGHVTLKVYDILGREVATLVNTLQQAGYESVEFDASKFSNGIYFYKLQTDKFTDVRKMILMK